jgi:hypothetical protein
LKNAGWDSNFKFTSGTVFLIQHALTSSLHFVTSLLLVSHRIRFIKSSKVIKLKAVPDQTMEDQRVSRIITILFIADLRAGDSCHDMVPLPSAQRQVTSCTGCWVGPTAGLEMGGRSRPNLHRKFTNENDVICNSPNCQVGYFMWPADFLILTGLKCVNVVLWREG